jgi:hypothetical protein
MRYLSVCSGIEAATVAWHPLGFAYRTQRHDWPEIWPPRLNIFTEQNP